MGGGGGGGVGSAWLKGGGGVKWYRLCGVLIKWPDPNGPPRDSTGPVVDTQYTPHQPRIRQDKSCTIRKDWRSRCAEGGAGFIRNVLPLTLSGNCLCLVAKTESPPLPLPCPEAVGMMSWCHAARLAASAARQNVKFVSVLLSRRRMTSLSQSLLEFQW